MGYSSTRSSVPKSTAERYGRHRLNKSLSTRCIITIGILLPILGAIIGVAAWAVGNEPVHLNSLNSKGSNMLYNNIPLRYRNDLFEERNDHLLSEQQKVPIGSSVFLDDLGSKMILDSEEKDQNSRDILEDVGLHSTPSPHPQENPQKKDPLYVVHYVPQGAQPEVTSPQTVQDSLSNSDVLSKILSASKVSGQKTPQFVVFAPMPADAPIQSFVGSAEQSPSDYEDYEERQERPILKKNRSKKRRKHGKSLRIMDRDEEAESSEIEQVRPYGSRHQLPISDDVIQEGTHDSQRATSVLKQTQSGFNQQNMHHRHRQQKSQYQKQHQYKQHQERQRLYEQQRQQQQQQQQQQQFFQLNEGSPRHPQKPCCDAEPSTYSHAPFPDPSPGFGGPLSEEHDADRYGHVSPPGISITLGGGKILPISPLGILRSLLRPLNPTFDLKKKMFFGVQLENGFGLGGKGKSGSDHGKHLDLTIGG